MMRSALFVVLLIAPLLSGCTDLFEDTPEREAAPADVGYAHDAVTVTSVVQTDASIMGFGNVTLDAVIYEPVTPDALEDGTSPPWPVVVFVHGFGTFKEMWQNAPLNNGGTPVTVASQPTDLLMDFAAQGMLVVAYDARGFGQSEGVATIAAAQEMADLSAVIDHAQTNFHTNGLVGVIGTSYGGAHALNAWMEDPRVTTAVSHNGWTDLYEGLIPGNVPKLEWGAAFYGQGNAASRFRLADDVHGWYRDAALRTNMDAVENALDSRSILDEAASNPKPLFVCQGMQESLLPQSHHAWMGDGGFRRAHYFTGGHASLDADCFEKAKEWFLFFLAGVDTGVDAWPVLTTVDANGDVPMLAYEDWPEIDQRAFHLREGLLTTYEASNNTFTVQQRGVSNPFQEPTFVWDMTTMDQQTVPEAMSQDPNALFFETSPLEESNVLLGAPRLTLEATAESTEAPFQVVGTLYHQAGGSVRTLGRAAYAVLDDGDHDNGTFSMEFPWVKVDMSATETLILKLSANDQSAFMPLMSNYAATFTGRSHLDVPFYAPPPREA